MATVWNLVCGVLTIAFLVGGPPMVRAQDCHDATGARLLGTFRLENVGATPVLSGTLYSLDRDNAVDWFQIEAGPAADGKAAPVEMIIRLETDGDASHRICHRWTGSADPGRLTCADGSQLRSHWDPSAGPAGSIQVFLPIRGGFLHPPESIAVILLAGPAAPIFELHIPYAPVSLSLADR